MNCYSAEDTLADILSVVGTDRGLIERVQITGADPILPSKFLIGTAGAGVIGAAGLGASELWPSNGAYPGRFLKCPRGGYWNAGVSLF